MLGCFSSLIILPTTHLTYCACRRDCESGAVLSYRYSVNAVGCTKYLSSLCGGYLDSTFGPGGVALGGPRMHSSRLFGVSAFAPLHNFSFPCTRGGVNSIRPMGGGDLRQLRLLYGYALL